MISILMATYNGEKYLEEQMDSLFSQTRQDFVLHVSDDCSSDRTMEILEDYKQKYPQRIYLYQKTSNSGNPKYNFLDLMMRIKDDYYMLCDQDDIWKMDKVDKSIKKLKEMERLYGIETPLLLHTDLTVTDKNGAILSPSFRKAMKANYDRTALNQLVIQNTLTGCTACYNRALAKQLVGWPTFFIMHDWWLILLSSAFGEIDYLTDQTVLYRQHASNEIGAKDVRKISYKLNKIRDSAGIRKAVEETYWQAEAFQKMYEVQLGREQNQMLRAYAQMPSYSRCKKYKTVFRYKIFKNGWDRKIAQMLYL